MSSSLPAIEAHELTKAYGEITALDGLSFTVRAGSVFGLLGPNGAGKSTTIKILTTLSRPTTGTATVAGLDVERRPADVRRAIGVVTQKPSTDPSATGRENLVLAAHLAGMSTRDATRRSDELLERFGLTEAGRRMVTTYSGGMQRKLDVAVGLVARPSVLFLDEPTTGLDPEARAAMWAEITRLSTQEQLSILLTTHYLEEADQLAETVAIVDHGRVVASGSPELLKSQLHGDSVLTELGVDADLAAARTAVARVGRADDVTVEGRRIRVRVDHGAGAVPLVLSALEAAGVPVVSITVARPSLDDVYLNVTGRSFGDAEQVAA